MSAVELNWYCRCQYRHMVFLLQIDLHTHTYRDTQRNQKDVCKIIYKFLMLSTERDQ